MYDKAKELGIDYISTGHYARTEYSKKYGRYVLKKGKNKLKDQSYVLYTIPKEIIKDVIFPLGDYENKEEIRKIAKENGMERVAKKPDSEDICFITNGDYKEFLEKNYGFKPKKGKIVDKNGNVLGEHTGIYKYTIGQRKGLGISYKEPLFVIGFDLEKNEVIVGEKKDIYKKEIYIRKVNLLLWDDLKNPKKANIKTRYSLNESKATIQNATKDEVLEYLKETNKNLKDFKDDKNILKDDEQFAKIIFDEPEPRITSGQSAVFYVDDDIVAGGGIII